MGRGGRGGGGWVGNGGGGVRLDMNEESKFLRKFIKKNWGGGLGGRVAFRGVGLGGSGWM